MTRVIDPRQQGARLSWLDDLFQQVPALDAPPLPEPIPIGDATESDWGELEAAMEAAK